MRRSIAAALDCGVLGRLQFVPQNPDLGIKTSGPNFVNLRELPRTFLVRFVYRNHHLGDVIGVPETVSLAHIEGDSKLRICKHVDVCLELAGHLVQHRLPESPRRPACQNRDEPVPGAATRGRPLARSLPLPATSARPGHDGDAAARLASDGTTTTLAARQPRRLSGWTAAPAIAASSSALNKKWSGPRPRPLALALNKGS